MEAVPQKTLRNEVGAVLRRVEAGESLLVTVAGRPVAQLCPVRRQQWVSAAELRRVWRGPAPRDVDKDLEKLPGDLVDPFHS